MLRKSASFRPALERLEDRQMLTVASGGPTVNRPIQSGDLFETRLDNSDIQLNIKIPTQSGDLFE